MVVADQDGRIIRINAQTERMFQYSRAELLGRQIEVLIPERFREQHVEQRAAYAAAPTMLWPMGSGPTANYMVCERMDKNFPSKISLGVLPTGVGFSSGQRNQDVTQQRRWKRN